MKLFDFKFLILLGLTLVVYFMYKEIDLQRERIQQLEDTYKKLLDKDPNEKEVELALPPRPQQPQKPQQPQQSQKPQQTQQAQNPQKNQVNLPSKKLEVPIVNNLKLELPSRMLEEKKDDIEKITETSEDDSNSESSSIISTSALNSDMKKHIQNKHLEIYSNDNENIAETSVSDSLINKINLQNQNQDNEKQSTKKEIETAKCTETNKIEGTKKSEDTKKGEDTNKIEDTKKEEDTKKAEDIKEREDTNKTEDNEETEDSDEKESDDEDSNEDSYTYEEEESDKKTEAVANKEVEVKKLSDKSESLEDVLNNLELNNLDLEINNKKSSKPTSNTLSKLKINEIQDLAKKENINLDKKINGVNKKKTKQELIDEIINCYN
jgi:hypothetical protein